jgi:hypothetical protein
MWDRGKATLGTGRGPTPLAGSRASLLLLFFHPLERVRGAERYSRYSTAAAGASVPDDFVRDRAAALRFGFEAGFVG